MPVTGRPRAVVLLSGGMDSCVCAAIAVRDFESAALHISYGQLTEEREAQAFTAVCGRLGIQTRLHLRNELFARIGGSALTDQAIPVPDAGVKIGERIPVTYVPFRNANLLAAAVSWAEVLGAEKIFIGAVEQDSSGYPDCRPGFFAAFQQAIAAGTKAGSEGRAIQIATPLIGMSKAAIVAQGVALGAPFESTWSCYRAGQQACGTCESCRLRLNAFSAAGIEDPLPYAAAGAGRNPARQTGL